VSTRLHYCQVTNFITETLKWTGITHATIAVDLQENNVEIVQSAEPPSGVEIKDLITAINLSERPPKTHPGGLFEWQVLENLI
jgi:rRNA processing protein Krr1/Pno1